MVFYDQDAHDGEASVCDHGAGGGNRTHTLLPKSDFESDASTSSATPAVTSFRGGKYRDVAGTGKLFFSDRADCSLVHPAGRRSGL